MDGNYYGYVAEFVRDQATGALTELPAPFECVTSGPSGCSTTYSPGITGADALALSPDGNSAYIVGVGAPGGGRVGEFARNLPICDPTAQTVTANTTVPIPLACVDPDGDLVTRMITAPPAHGTLGPIDRSAGTVAFTPAHGYAGSDSFQFAASDGVLQSKSATASLTIQPAAPSSSTTTTPSSSTTNTSRWAIATFTVTEATISSLGETNSTFVVRGSSTPLTGQTAAQRHKKGTVFSFRLDQPATVKVGIQTKAGGRRVRRGCEPDSRNLRHKPRCIRTITIATLTRTARAGLNRVAFTGRIHGEALKAGRYQAVFRAVDSTGASPPKTLSFTIATR
jgi:hypothetical protein